MSNDNETAGAAFLPDRAAVYRLFDPFQRLNRTRVDDHHSLGLSIVRAFAIAHDATLSAHPRGCLVTVTATT